MFDKIGHWLIYTIIFALLPTLITLLFGWIFGHFKSNYCAELLYFIIMVCATSLEEIRVTKKHLRECGLFKLFKWFNRIMIMTISMVYGGVLKDELSGSVVAANNNLTIFSVILSVTTVMVGLIIQILIGRVEGKKK